jgi:hypothetical protein
VNEWWGKAKKGRGSNCCDVQSAISDFIQRGFDGGINDAINHHLQFGLHDQGINQSGLISVITLKNY